MHHNALCYQELHYKLKAWPIGLERETRSRENHEAFFSWIKQLCL